MQDKDARLTNPEAPPTPQRIKGWIGEAGHAYWMRAADTIEKNYPGVFDPEWLYGGKKHGWSLRYKKSRSFCTFIPERDCFHIQIVFGAKEREKLQEIRDQLSQETLKAYDAATTYHDGKWLFLPVNSDRVLQDIERMLAVKRKPRKGTEH